jgi:glycosyltransferase involved in cell wall biosynthesis
MPANVLPALVPDTVAPPLGLLSLQPRAGLRRWFRRLGRHDIVQFDYCASAASMDDVAHETKVVYSAHNVERDFWDGERKRGPFADRWLRRLAALERHAVTRAALVVTCTHEDAARLAELYGPLRRLVVVPNGSDRVEVAADPAQRDRARAALGVSKDERAILFVGGRAPHNREAARFLVERVLPALDRPARLFIVGRGGDGLHPRDSRVICTGFVDDLRPYLAAADVGVNPVDHSSGSSVKVAQYLTAGLPVVATPGGLRGYRTLPDGVTVVARERFPDALQGQLPERGSNGNADGLAWERQAAILHSAYAELLGH